MELESHKSNTCNLCYSPAIQIHHLDHIIHRTSLCLESCVKCNLNPSSPPNSSHCLKPQEHQMIRNHLEQWQRCHYPYLHDISGVQGTPFLCDPPFYNGSIECQMLRHCKTSTGFCLSSCRTYHPFVRVFL